MPWYDYAEIVVAVLLVGALTLLAVVIRSRRLQYDDGDGSGPAEGMERSTRREYSLPKSMEVIRFGQSYSRQDGLRTLERMNRRLATDLEIEAFLRHNPEVGIDWDRDFIVVPPT